MRYLALASDYDGTLAWHGQVATETLSSLERVLTSGRKLILVTGRELEDLLTVFPHASLFDKIVAENGALVYTPATREQKPLCDPPPEVFIRALQERQITPLSVGRVIVSTWHPNEATVLEVIRDLGLELQVVFNKGAVMVLPSGINKAAGLKAALKDLKLSPHNVVGIGDAENDHAFMELCEASAAVANALPMVKEGADLVTAEDHGAGVSELVQRLVDNDLRDIEDRLAHQRILLGTRNSGQEVSVSPYGVNVLLAGTSGSGKSTLAAGFLERLSEKDYQFCIIDPEGDYETFEGAVILGTRQRAPTVAEVLQLLESPENNAVVNLLGLPLDDRPSFFSELFPSLGELRVRTGRPHWLVIDEAHHLLPTSWNPAPLTLSQELYGLMLITVHPDQVTPAILSSVDVVVAVGESPDATLASFAGALGQEAPAEKPVTLNTGEALVWLRRTGDSPFTMEVVPSQGDRRRHQRKYAEGDLGPDKSFYFRGPEEQLNLRAQNLMLFLQIADGVDDVTWMHHLRQRDYSRWFREAIKDDTLASEASRVEEQPGVSPTESRSLIRTAIEQRYTLPESPPAPA